MVLYFYKKGDDIVKVSLSTFFLIIAILAICVMGYLFATTLQNEVSDNKISDAEVSVATSVSFVSLSGIYVGDAEVEPGTTPDGDAEVSLYLYENGSFCYYDSPGLASGHVGYYTFVDDDLVLHEVVACANDIGRTITSNVIALKIGDDDSIVDSNLNAVLKKSSKKIDDKSDVISSELKNALDNNSLR